MLLAGSRPVHILHSSRPYLQERIPASGAYSRTIEAHADAAHTIVVPGKATDLLASERVPYVAVKVVVAREQKASGDRHGHRRDATEDLIMSVKHEFGRRTAVVETTRGIIGT